MSNCRRKLLRAIWQALSRPALAFLFLLLIIIPPSSTYANDKTDPQAWNSLDTALETSYLVTHHADYRQTLIIARNPDQYNEENPFLGPEPDVRSVRQFFGYVALSHLAISYILPRPYRTIWQSVTIINSGNAVYQNHHRIGLAIEFHF